MISSLYPQPRVAKIEKMAAEIGANHPGLGAGAGS